MGALLLWETDMTNLAQLKTTMPVGKKVKLAYTNIVNHAMLGRTLPVTEHTDEGIVFGDKPFATFVPWPEESHIEFRGANQVTVAVLGVSLEFEVQAEGT